MFKLGSKVKVRFNIDRGEGVTIHRYDKGWVVKFKNSHESLNREDDYIHLGHYFNSDDCDRNCWWYPEKDLILVPQIKNIE